MEPITPANNPRVAYSFLAEDYKRLKAEYDQLAIECMALKRALKDARADMIFARTHINLGRRKIAIKRLNAGINVIRRFLNGEKFSYYRTVSGPKS